jgi:hypothetical protein
MRYVSVMLAWWMVVPCSPRLMAQTAAPKLNLVIVEGEGQINNIRQRTAREPIVQVEDENHKPIAGAAVVFLLPNTGAGGTFADGSHSLTVITDSQGRAVARGLKPNHAQGQYQIHVSASFNGQAATAVISQSNVMGAAGAGAAAGTAAGISGKLIAVIAIVGAAAVGGGVYAATHAGSANNPATNPSTSTVTTITVGSGSVGPPR